PHRDDVRHTLAARHKLALPVPDLIDDLPDGEITHQSHLARRAERAGHRTASLRREAHRVACAVVRHEHRLDVMTVVQPQERLARLAVRARDLGLGLDGAEAERPREQVAQGFGQVGQLIPARLGPARDMPPDLARAIDGFLAIAQPRDERALGDIADRWMRGLHLTSLPVAAGTAAPAPL